MTLLRPQVFSEPPLMPTMWLPPDNAWAISTSVAVGRRTLNALFLARSVTADFEPRTRIYSTKVLISGVSNEGSLLKEPLADFAPCFLSLYISRRNGQASRRSSVPSKDCLSSLITGQARIHESAKNFKASARLALAASTIGARSAGISSAVCLVMNSMMSCAVSPGMIVIGGQILLMEKTI
jgi:hypothetical protein